MASAPARLGEGTGRPPPRRAHPSRRRDRGSSEGLAVDPAGIALEALGLVLGGEEVDAHAHRLQIVEVMAPMGIMNRSGAGALGAEQTIVGAEQRKEQPRPSTEERP